MRRFANGLMVGLAVLAMLTIASNAQAEYVLMVDMGATGQVVASGWSELSCSSDGGVSSVSGTYGAISVTVSSNVGGVGYLSARNRNAVTAPNVSGDVARDFIYADDHDMTFTISGLAAGAYEMTTYQHDAAYGGIGRIVPTVTVTDAAGTSVRATDVYDTTGYSSPFSYKLINGGTTYYQDDVASVSYSIYSDGTNPITVVYAGGLYQGYYTPPTISGFTINQVPEPSSLVLIGCGLFGLLAYAWRKRK